MYAGVNVNDANPGEVVEVQAPSLPKPPELPAVVLSSPSLSMHSHEDGATVTADE